MANSLIEAYEKHTAFHILTKEITDVKLFVKNHREFKRYTKSLFKDTRTDPSSACEEHLKDYKFFIAYKETEDIYTFYFSNLTRGERVNFASSVLNSIYDQS